ncbi:MAG: DUF86 domain-containing protein [Candidatus Methanoperedens sp.]|nr:DUF86 domain-containing protein [Candidatus Methanoperedens sp.]
MILDKDGMIGHLRELNAAQSDWERYRTISLEDMKNDRDKMNMVLHAMLVAIQSAIDISNHIIAEKKLRKPATYREAFEILQEGGFIPLQLSHDLSELAGFRNVLVHIYWKLDINVIYGILQNDLDTIKKFERIIKDMLLE